MRKNILFYIFISLLISFLAYSFIFVGTIPIAIVSGNSMYPTLQNGDLVIFAPASGVIPNGTIIIYAQQGINDKFFSWLTGRIIIHRIVGVYESNSSDNYYYITKGDNNLFNDSLPVFQKQILGVPVFVIPKLGLLFLFFGSPYGLFVLFGMLVTIYLRNIDSRQQIERRISKFILTLGKEALKESIPKEIYQKAEIYLKYAYEVDEIDDIDVKKLAQFIVKTKLKDFEFKDIKCEKCGKGVIFNSKSLNLWICYDKVELYEQKQ